MTYAESIDEYKAQLADLEESAMADLIEAYLLIQDALLADLERLEATLRDAADQPVSAATLARSEALNALIDQTQERVTQLAAQLGLRISSSGQQAIDLAQEAVRQLTLDSMGTPPVDAITAGFGQLPAEAIERIVSNLQPGSPLSRLLAELGPDAAEAVRQALIVGLGSGQSPREVARAMQDALGGSLTRAATIARTEILRAYRDAAVESMRANDDVVKGWIWHASLTDRTCAACIAMHGTKHPLSEPFGSHPNCRCTPVPETLSWADLGFEGIDDTAPEIASGTGWFARQDAETQRKILGQAKYDAWKDGAFTFDEVVGFRDDPTWGPTRWERSLKDLLAA